MRDNVYHSEGVLVGTLDEEDGSGANHIYRVYLRTAEDANPTTIRRTAEDANPTTIRFQKGPVKEAGVNGLTNEALLAIVQHRLLGFQSGPYQCMENGQAIYHIHRALDMLESRTKHRVVDGTEGTSEELIAVMGIPEPTDKTSGTPTPPSVEEVETEVEPALLKDVLGAKTVQDRHTAMETLINYRVFKGR